MLHLLVPHLLKNKPYDNNPTSQKILFTSAVYFGLEFSFLSIYLSFFSSFRFPEVIILVCSTVWDTHSKLVTQWQWKTQGHGPPEWSGHILRGMSLAQALKAKPNVCALGKSKSSHQAVQDAVSHWKTADRERETNTNREYNILPFMKEVDALIKQLYTESRKGKASWRHTFYNLFWVWMANSLLVR